MADNHVELIEKQFTRQAEIYAQMPSTRDSSGLASIVALARTNDESRVLDVACGPGFLSREFAILAKQVIGVDITRKFLHMAQSMAEKEGLDNLTFQQGNVNKLPFEDNSFDIVVCRAAMHHFPDPTTVLREMSRVVDSAGIVVIADMLSSEDPLKAKRHNEIEILCDPTHTTALPLSQFRSICNQAKLEISREYKSSQDYDLESWIDHGSPAEETAEKIRQCMQTDIEEQFLELNVRLENGSLYFSHQTILILAKPARGTP